MLVEEDRYIVQDQIVGHLQIYSNGSLPLDISMRLTFPRLRFIAISGLDKIEEVQHDNITISHLLSNKPMSEVVTFDM